jgi:hypothetical protein
MAPMHARSLLVVVGLVLVSACGHAAAPPPAPPAPPPPTLADEVDAMCACTSPACAQQVHDRFAIAESTTSTAPHVVALRDKLASCDMTAREGDDLAQFHAMDTAMCACKDAACVDQVEKDFADFMRRMEKKYVGHVRPDEAMMKLGAHMATCMSDAMSDKAGVGVAPSSPAPAATASASAPTGVAECDQYLSAFDRYMACPKIPQEAKDASKAGVAEMKEGWAMLRDPGVPPEAKKAAADACREAVSALRQSAKAMGCPL